MSLMRPVSAANAINYYYEEDPVFSKDERNNSEWLGKSSEILNFRGEIRKEEFANILHGLHPMSKEELVQRGVNSQHRAGMDFVFSAPKSVSIHGVYLQERGVSEAHNKAVKEAVTYMESIVTYRSTEDGQTTYEKSGNLVAAAFHHSTSRANDPQLHTHVVVANMTQTNDGWRAISNESLFLQQNNINQVYQNYLAHYLMEAGYSIERKNGSFEIAGYKDEWIKEFSKRSEEVTKYLTDNLETLKQQYPNASHEELVDIARLASRDSKDHRVTAEELHKNWESRVSKDLIIEHTNRKEQQHLKDFDLEKATGLITESQSLFSKDQLALEYLKLNIGTKTIDDFDKEFRKMQSENEIVPVGAVNTRIGTKSISLETQLYTTSEVLELEKAIMNRLENQQHQQPLSNQTAIDKYLENSSLTSGQNDLIKSILTSDKQFIFVQGDAGTGKTYALEKLADILREESPSTNIIGAGYTGKAAAEIESKTSGKIKAHTLHSLLNNSDAHITTKDTLLIVDEASMISSKQFSSIINLAEATDVKIVFIGDTKQLQPVQAGQIFKDAVERFGADAVMTENMRQKTEIAQQAVEYVKQYAEGLNDEGIKDAIDSLKSASKIYEDASFSKAIEKAAEDYIKSTEEGKYPLLITHRNEIKDILNSQIRNEILPPDAQHFELNVREQLNISRTDKFSSHSYQEGQSVFLNSSTENLRAGSEWKIASIDHENNSLSLTNSKGFNAEIDLHEHGQSISAFSEQTKEFAAGDRIVFEKNDHLLGVKNGQTGRIDSFENGILTVTKDSGESISFKPETYNYLDHGYALTVHKAQGQTCDTVQYITEGNDRMINTEGFYVAMTRAKDDIRIYTDNADKLAERAELHENEHSLHKMLDNDKSQAHENTAQMEI